MSRCVTFPTNQSCTHWLNLCPLCRQFEHFIRSPVVWPACHTRAVNMPNTMKYGVLKVLTTTNLSPVSQFVNFPFTRSLSRLMAITSIPLKVSTLDMTPLSSDNGIFFILILKEFSTSRRLVLVFYVYVYSPEPSDSLEPGYVTAVNSFWDGCTKLYMAYPFLFGWESISKKSSFLHKHKWNNCLNSLTVLSSTGLPSMALICANVIQFKTNK